MQAYAVTHIGRENGEPFSNYIFDVRVDGCKVAELSHDYRGDAHWMRLPNGPWIELPRRIIEGGGPQPLTLSSAGVEAVANLIG
jgi:hypothetical protein